MKPILFLFIFAATSNCLAYVGAVSSATAESGRASVESTDAPFLNPAALAHIKGYLFSAGFATSANKKQEIGQDFAVSITDNLSETVVPTSIAYVQSKIDPNSEEQVTRDFRLSLGNFMSKRLAGGLALRYRDDQLALNRYTQMNLNIGALYSFHDSLGVGLVLDNILGAKSDIPEDLRQRPQMSVGGSYIYKKFLRTRFDLISAENNSFDRPTIAAGLESYMNRWVIIRLGVQRQNEKNANIYSAGVGFAGPRFGVHYAYLTSQELDSFNRHSVDLSLPIW